MRRDPALVISQDTGVGNYRTHVHAIALQRICTGSLRARGRANRKRCRSMCVGHVLFRGRCGRCSRRIRRANLRRVQGRRRHAVGDAISVLPVGIGWVWTVMGAVCLGRRRTTTPSLQPVEDGRHNWNVAAWCCWALGIHVGNERRSKDGVELRRASYYGDA
jgi:hypothetical protein